MVCTYVGKSSHTKAHSTVVQGRLHHGMHEAIVQRRIVVVFKHTRVHATDLDPVCDLRASAGFNSESGSPVPSNTTGVR